MAAVAVDLTQGIMNGFATGVGVGLANWIIIKRLENLEKREKLVKEQEDKK